MTAARTASSDAGDEHPRAPPAQDLDEYLPRAGGRPILWRFYATLAQEISPQQRILWQDPRNMGWGKPPVCRQPAHRFRPSPCCPDLVAGGQVDLTLETTSDANWVIRTSLQKAGPTGGADQRRLREVTRA